MHVLDLMYDFTVGFEGRKEDAIITLNGRPALLDMDSLEDLEDGLCRLSHAIMVYRRTRSRLDE